MLFPANRFDGYHLFDLVNVVENPVRANPHFPGGEVIGPKRLAVACLYQRLRRKLVLNGVEDGALSGLFQETQIIQGAFGEPSLKHREITKQLLYSSDRPAGAATASGTVALIFLPGEAQCILTWAGR